MCCNVTLQDFKNKLPEKERNTLPLELLFVIVNFLPFSLKWVNKRVLLSFDIFILKNQRQWIICLRKIVDPVSFVMSFGAINYIFSYSKRSLASKNLNLYFFNFSFYECSTLLLLIWTVCSLILAKVENWGPDGELGRNYANVLLLLIFKFIQTI